MYHVRELQKFHRKRKKLFSKLDQFRSNDRKSGFGPCFPNSDFLRLCLKSNNILIMARRSIATTVRMLEAKLKRKQAKEAKKRAKAALKSKAEGLRKKLRGY